MDSTVLDRIATHLGASRLRATSCRNEDYIAGRHERVYVPREATNEFRALSDKSEANFIGLIVRSILQDLRATAYRHGDKAKSKAVWDAWVRQGMVAKHGMAFRQAVVHGHSYLALVPEQRRGSYTWSARVFSPHEVYVEYEDAINDPRPAVFACKMPGVPHVGVVWIDRNVFLMDLRTKAIIQTGSTSQQFFGDTEPVVRLVGGDWIVTSSMDWGTTGEVAPLINAQNRLRQAIMDLLLVQTFGAVALRWIAGLELKGDEAEATNKKIEMAADRFLTADDPDTKFGSLIGTPLEPFIRNVTAALEMLVMLSQSSPTRFMSKIENVGNDAILTAREPYEAKLTAYRESFGASLEAFARAVAVAEGLGDPGPEGYFTWRATELRTLAELMDAVVKAVSAGFNAEPLLRRNLTWNTEEQDELLDGYQRSRLEGDPATRELVGALSRRASTEVATVPARGSQTGAGNPSSP